MGQILVTDQCGGLRRECHGRSHRSFGPKKMMTQEDWGKMIV